MVSIATSNKIVVFFNEILDRNHSRHATNRDDRFIDICFVDFHQTVTNFCPSFSLPEYSFILSLQAAWSVESLCHAKKILF